MKKLQATLLAGALAITAALGVNAGNVWASDTNSLKITPSGARVTLEAGKTLEGTADGCVSVINDSCSVEVENTGQNTFKYKAYVTPYAVTGSDNQLSFSDEHGTAYTQISRWIKIKDAAGKWVSEAVFTIKPGEKQKINFQINIPQDIPGGSQYAVLWAQIMSDENATGIQTVGQVGSVITGRSTTNTVEKVSISDFDLTGFTFGGKLNAAVKVKNEGNTDFVINYKYVAKTFFGKEIHTEEGQVAAYPETEYDVKAEWATPPMLGIFHTEYTIAALDHKETKSRIVVIMPLIVMILLILLLTVVVVWIIIIIRKRKERLARKLV